MIAEFTSTIGTIRRKYVNIYLDSHIRIGYTTFIVDLLYREIAFLVDQAYTTALNLLREKQEKLIAIAERLMQVETIDDKELDAMLFAA